MFHSEALQVPGTVQVLRRKVQQSRELELIQPWDPSTNVAVPPSCPSQLLQPYLSPLPKLLFHQSADAKFLVHLLQQFCLWDREGWPMTSGHSASPAKTQVSNKREHKKGRPGRQAANDLKQMPQP